MCLIWLGTRLFNCSRSRLDIGLISPRTYTSPQTPLVGLTSFTLAPGFPSAANFINDMHFHMYTFLLTLGSQLQCCWLSLLPFSILSLCYLATLNFIPSRCFVNPVDTSMWIPITMHSIKAISSCLFHNCLAGSSFLFMSSLLIFFPPSNSVFSILLCISEETIRSAIFIPSLLSAGCPLLLVIICLFLVVMIFVHPFIASLGNDRIFLS